MKSIETLGAGSYPIIPFNFPEAASATQALTSSSVTRLEASKVRSMHDTFGVGTRMAVPSSLPAISGNTSPRAIAAPVDVGIKARAAARAR